MCCPSVTYFIHENWKRDPAGTSTFVRIIEAEWLKRGVQFIELPFEPGSNTGGVTEAESAPATTRLAGNRLCKALLLCMGYMRRFRDDVRFLRQVRPSVKGVVLLTNQFGCETLPLALRWVFPMRRILAIAHTHPGQDAAANHIIRSAVERLCYHVVSGVIYNSNAVMGLWAKKLGRRAVKGRVIRHGLPDVATGLPADYPPKVAGSVDFVYVARFYSWKGQEDFLHVWKMSCAEVGPSRLIFVGDGERLEAARLLSKKLGIESSVVFMGARPDGAAYFQGGDVAVLLSTEPEAFGFVLLEAMRSGRAILASSLGGIAEVVEDGVTGILVNPADTAAVSDAVRRLVEHPGWRASMGTQGRKRWEQRFSLDRMLGEYDAMFKVAVS